MKNKKSDSGPLSLHPLTPEDALRAALGTPPPQKELTSKKQTQAKGPKRTKK